MRTQQIQNKILHKTIKRVYNFKLQISSYGEANLKKYTIQVAKRVALTEQEDSGYSLLDTQPLCHCSLWSSWKACLWCLKYWNQKHDMHINHSFGYFLNHKIESL